MPDSPVPERRRDYDIGEEGRLMKRRMDRGKRRKQAVGEVEISRGKRGKVEEGGLI